MLTDADKVRISEQLRLWKAGLSKLQTEEDFLRRSGWQELMVAGDAFGEEWSDYSVGYVGWELELSLAPGQSLPGGWYAHPCFRGLHTPNDPDKALKLCAVRIYYCKSEAFAEILFQSPTEPTTLDSIQNAQSCKSPSEIQGVWRGFGLFKELQKSRGPQSMWNKDTFFNQSVEAYVKRCNRLELERCRKEDIAEELLMKREYWYELARKFGIEPKSIDVEARRILCQQRDEYLTVR